MSIKKRLIDLEEKVIKGLEAAFNKMLKMKTINGTPVVVSRKGKVVKMDSGKLSKRIEQKTKNGNNNSSVKKKKTTASKKKKSEATKTNR